MREPVDPVASLRELYGKTVRLHQGDVEVVGIVVDVQGHVCTPHPGDIADAGCDLDLRIALADGGILGFHQGGAIVEQVGAWNSQPGPFDPHRPVWIDWGEELGPVNSQPDVRGRVAGFAE